MKPLYNLLEKLIFIFINLFFSCTYLLLFLVLHISSMVVNIINNDSVLSYDTKGDFCFIFLSIVVWVVFIILKLFVFQVFYGLKKFSPNIHRFLERYINDKDFRLNVLKYTILLDVFCFFVSNIFIAFESFNMDMFWLNLLQNNLLEQYLGTLDVTFITFCIMIGGVTPCYLFFGRRMKKS